MLLFIGNHVSDAMGKLRRYAQPIQRLLRDGSFRNGKFRRCSTDSNAIDASHGTRIGQTHLKRQGRRQVVPGNIFMRTFELFSRLIIFFCQVMVDVSHFRPEEISVKTTDKNIIVHGKLI